MGTRRRCPHRLVQLGVTMLFTGTLCVSAHASVPAHPGTPALPLLRLDYYATVPNWTLDPAQANVGEAELNALVRANLVHIVPDDRPVPDLATWMVSKDHLVYTFTIRSDARFSNGDYVTAQDAAFSIERALSRSTQPPAPGGTIAQPYLSLILGADAYSGELLEAKIDPKYGDARSETPDSTLTRAFFNTFCRYTQPKELGSIWPPSSWSVVSLIVGPR